MKTWQRHAGCALLVTFGWGMNCGSLHAVESKPGDKPNVDNTVPASARAQPTKAASAIVISPTLFKQNPDMQGGYWRIVSRIPEGDRLPPEAAPLTETAKKKFLQQLWEENKSLLIVAKARLGDKRDQIAKQLFFANVAGTVDPNQQSVTYLTPWQTDLAGASVQFSVTRAAAAHSETVNLAVQALAKAAPFFDRGALSAVLTTPAALTASQRADEAIARYFSDTNTKPSTIDFTPLATSGNPGIAAKVFFVGDKPSAENTLFVIQQEFKETALTGTGLRGDISTDTATISSQRIPTADGDRPLEALLRNANPGLLGNLERATPDAIQAFCRGIRSELKKLGLAELDQLVVTRAYLKATVWARKAEARPESDECVTALDETRLAQLVPKLAVFPTVVRAADTWESGRALRDTLIPKAFFADNEQRLMQWKAILADTVTLTAVNNAVNLSDTVELKARTSNQFTGQEVAALLASAPWNWAKKGGASCFAPVSARTSYLMMHARSGCIRWGKGNAAVPMPVMFVTTGSANPKIQEIHFWADD